MKDVRPYPATPQQARAAGVAYYFTGKVCPRGHRAMQTLDGVCLRFRHADEMREYRSRS